MTMEPARTIALAEETSVRQRANGMSASAEDLGYYTCERFAREPNTMITGLQTPNLDKLASQSVAHQQNLWVKIA